MHIMILMMWVVPDFSDIRIRAIDGRKESDIAGDIDSSIMWREGWENLCGGDRGLMEEIELVGDIFCRFVTP